MKKFLLLLLFLPLFVSAYTTEQLDVMQYRLSKLEAYSSIYTKWIDFNSDNPKYDTLVEKLQERKTLIEKYIVRYKTILEENNISLNKYYVDRVVDGDTILLTNKRRVRLLGINAPEIDLNEGVLAKNKLRELIEKKAVILEQDPYQDNEDHYDRLLRYVYTTNNINVNKYMIENGYAKEYTYEGMYKYQEDFRNAEQQAKENKKGMWGSNIEIQSGMCGRKQYCDEMSSCAEAQYYLIMCGVERLDSDRDGIPCESLCGNY